jgi:two-component system phosphate regulon sensor histidine kinase PhoR
MHRVSLKIAGLLAAAFLALSWVLSLVLGFGLTLSALVALAVLSGALAYAAAWFVLARRLRAVQELTAHIRSHAFATMQPASNAHPDELDTLHDDVYRSGTAFEKEIREMKRMETYRRDFIGNVSHELKTPIFAVQGFAETLLDGGLEDEKMRRSFVEKILRNAGRLANLARDLNELAKIETGAVRMAPASFSLSRLIREVAESLEVQARERDVSVRLSVPEWLPPAYADREAIRQVLLNLVDNGVKYNNPGGYVELSARKSDGENLRVTVVDNGIGIDAEDLPRVTERFFRVDKSRSRSQGGTGLGLAIVKHLLAAHQRRLLVDSTPGQGSTFGFTLPIAQGG